MKAMSPSQIKKFVINCLLIREIPYISGPPGIGKSDIMEQIADEFNLKMIDVRLSQKLPEDLSGLPSLNEKTGKAEYNPFDTFPMEGDEIPDGYSGWMIFLDELSSASEEVFAAIYSLLLGHTVGGKKVHSKAVIVAAGNRSTDSAIARPLPDTLITRMLPAQMKVSSTDWLKWAASASDSNDTVIEFIKKYPDMLHSTMDHNTREEVEPYPTPRGWRKVFKIVNLHEKTSNQIKKPRRDSAGIPVTAQEVSGSPITEEIQAMMFAAIGTAAGQTFKEHYNENMQIPYPWEVAQSPSSTKIPGTTMGKAKLTSDLADHFIETQEQSRDSILQFMNRMDKEHAALFAQILAEKLGNTASDVQLIENVKKRLNVEKLILGSKEDPEDPDSIAIPFGQALQLGRPSPILRPKKKHDIA